MSDLVDEVDLSAFYGPYAGDGRRDSPYEPRMMVEVLVCAYATGTLLVAGNGEEAGGGHRVSDAGGRQLSEAPDAVRVPPPAVVSDIMGATWRAILRAMIEGRKTPGSSPGWRAGRFAASARSWRKRSPA